MPMSINHLTFVISIQKLDTVFVEINAETGYEIRTYDEYAFMREVGAYLDTEDGIVLDDVFEHFTTQLLSGVEYARLFKIVPPYTITVEDGAYQVKLGGGTNTNFLDVLNPNNVSVIPDNSAGKQVITSGSGVTEQDKIDIIQGTLTGDISAMDDPNTLGGAAVHLKHLEYKLFVNDELINPEIEDGSQHNPYSNETIAINYAEAHGILNLRLMADIKFTRQIKNFYVDSVNVSKIDANNQNLNGSRFQSIELSGTYLGSITAQDCSLSGVTTLNGFFDNCALGSSFTIPDGGQAFISQTKALVPDLIPADISVGGVSGTGMLNMMDYTGGIIVKDCNQVTDLVKIVLNGGSITIDESCTNGRFRLFGHGIVINNGTVTDYEDNCIDPRKLKDIPNDVLDEIL